jgi:hypothetical protein
VSQIAMPDDFTHYVIRGLLDGPATFLLWYTDERDGLVREPDGRLLRAPSPEAMTEAVGERGLRAEAGDEQCYDLDAIAAWCRSPTPAGIDCPAFLDAWNLSDDSAGTHGPADRVARPDADYVTLSRASSAAYDKLFWGNNLPSVTPPGERYEPP